MPRSARRVPRCVANRLKRRNGRADPVHMDPVNVTGAARESGTGDPPGRLARILRRAVAERIRAGRYRPPLCAVAEAVLPWILVDPLPLAGPAPARHTARR